MSKILYNNEHLQDLSAYNRVKLNTLRKKATSNIEIINDEVKIIPVSAFLFDTRAYAFYPNTNWITWVESDFNTDGFIIADNCVMKDNRHVVTTDGTSVLANDMLKIQEYFFGGDE